jgi:ribosomal RNA-processing protein 8
VGVIAKWLVTNFRKQSPCVVADFGCGDAALAQKLVGYNHKQTCPFRVHSFDLVATSDLVTACDMAHVPLSPKTVDVAVFCLSLMGTNLADFLREAYRVLKDTGVLKIAEVRSRFESTDKKDELKDFVQVLDKLGFKCLKMDRSNKMFVMLECKKNGKKPQADLSFTAKPCIYKRR